MALIVRNFITLNIQFKEDDYYVSSFFLSIHVYFLGRKSSPLLRWITGGKMLGSLDTEEMVKRWISVNETTSKEHVQGHSKNV